MQLSNYWQVTDSSHGVMYEPMAGVLWEILEDRNVTSDWSLLIFVLTALTIDNGSKAALITEMSHLNSFLR